MDLLPYEEYAASQNRKRTPAGVLLTDADSRVLLVRTSYTPPGVTENWTIPGGGGEAGEPPWRTARRELLEELGLDRPCDRLLAISHIPENGPMAEGLAFVFDGGTITPAEVAALRPTDPEIAHVGLYTLAEASERVKPELAGRLRAALNALVSGNAVMCEAGRPVAGDTPSPA